MNFRRFFFAALCLAGPTLSPVVAQLIHISVDMPDGFLLFKTDDASIPWNTSAGFITQLDFTYDSQAHVGELDPGRNTWHMRVENPALGQNFEFTRPFERVWTFDQGLTFEYAIHEINAFAEATLTLVFDSPIPTDGSLPKFPLPELGSTDFPVFRQSHFGFYGTNSVFHVPHLAEAYGGSDIRSITVTMTPIPEPSIYGLAALAVAGAAIVARRRKRLVVSG